MLRCSNIDLELWLENSTFGSTLHQKWLL